MTFETPSATTPAPIFAFAVVVGKYYSLAGLVLLIYDHLTTFDREVERIWSSRFTAASLLFYLNRYLTVILYATLTVGVFDPTWSVQTCQHFIIIPAVGTVVLQGVTSLVMLLRTYALWSRKTPVLVVLVVSYLVLMALSVRAMVAGRRYNPEQILYPGCMIIVPGALRLNPLVHAWLALISFDTLVVTLTLWRTINIHRMGGKMPLTTLLLRDGVAYFAAIALANLSYFFIYVVAIPVNMTIAQAISAIMTSRLILNLRTESRATTVVDEDDSVNFHRSGKSGMHLSQDHHTPKLETHGQLESHYDPRQDVSRSTRPPSTVPRLSDASAVFEVPDLEAGPAVPPKDPAAAGASSRVQQQQQSTRGTTAADGAENSQVPREAWLGEMQRQQLAAVSYAQRQAQLRKERLSWMGNFGAPMDEADDEESEEGEFEEGEVENVAQRQQQQRQQQRQLQQQQRQLQGQRGMKEMGDFNSWDIDVEKGTIGQRGDDGHSRSNSSLHLQPPPPVSDLNNYRMDGGDWRRSVSSSMPSSPRTLVDREGAL